MKTCIVFYGGEVSYKMHRTMETAQYRSGGYDFDAKKAGLSLTHRPQYALTLQSYYFLLYKQKNNDQVHFIGKISGK